MGSDTRIYLLSDRGNFIFRQKRRKFGASDRPDLTVMSLIRSKVRADGRLRRVKFVLALR